AWPPGARPSRSSPSWPCSRPGARTCRSIRPTPRSGCASWSRTRRWRWRWPSPGPRRACGPPAPPASACGRSPRRTTTGPTTGRRPAPLASQETLLSPPDLTAMLREERVTMADLPPALLTLLPEDELPDLRLLFVGLEPYPGDLVNRWARGGRRFVNGYGPTEATVAVTTMECLPPMDQSPPIGGPPGNHRPYV